MARGFGVTVDFIVGNSAPTSPQIETVAFEAAYPTILSMVRRIGLYSSQGRNVFADGTIFSIPIERYAEEEAAEIVRRFVSMIGYLKEDSDGQRALPSKSSEEHT